MWNGLEHRLVEKRPLKKLTYSDVIQTSSILTYFICRFLSWLAMPPRIWRWSVSLPGIYNWPSVVTRNWTPLSKLPLPVVVLSLTSTSLSLARRVKARNNKRKKWQKKLTFQRTIFLQPVALFKKNYSFFRKKNSRRTKNLRYFVCWKKNDAI